MPGMPVAAIGAFGLSLGNFLSNAAATPATSAWAAGTAAKNSAAQALAAIKVLFNRVFAACIAAFSKGHKRQGRESIQNKTRLVKHRRAPSRDFAPLFAQTPRAAPSGGGAFNDKTAGLGRRPLLCARPTFGLFSGVVPPRLFGCPVFLLAGPARA